MVELDAAPSPELVRALVEVDTAHAGRTERLAVIGAWERVLAWAQAMQDAELVGWDRAICAEVEEDQWPDQRRWWADEVALVLGSSGSAAQARIERAVLLAEKLPATAAALRAGEVTGHHARTAARST